MHLKISLLNIGLVFQDQLDEELNFLLGSSGTSRNGIVTFYYECSFIERSSNFLDKHICLSFILNRILFCI